MTTYNGLPWGGLKVGTPLYVFKGLCGGWDGMVSLV